MVLTFRRRIAILLLIVFAALGAPATAHEKHASNQAAAQQRADGAGDTHGHSARQAMPADHAMGTEQPRPTAFAGRLISWLGRMHPFAVHFPIALFPISWLALILARRRGDKVDLIRAFIVAAGVGAAVAATLGWVNAGLAFVDRDPIQFVHRWIGTGLGALGAVIALWAWRRADAVSGRLMVWTLGLATVVLLVQGWLGGALTHGVEHMMF